MEDFGQHENGQLRIEAAGEQRSLLPIPDEQIPTDDAAPAVESAPPRRTRRERLEARAERRREWAVARDRDGDAARDRVHEIGDRIPFGQPIIVGHYSEKGARADQRRMENGRRKAVENWNMADRHEQAAKGIESQLRGSIYSDDVDAVDRLEQKIARLEAKREGWKKYNAARRRKDIAATDFLDEQQQAEVVSLARFSHLGTNGQAPAYVLTNLTANIRRLRGRLEEIKRDAATREAGSRGRGRPMLSRYAGTCPVCGHPIGKGSPIVYYRVTREALHADCVGAAA
jgi:DNA repair exonuclease SbcCD ATPase subunit